MFLDHARALARLFDWLGWAQMVGVFWVALDSMKIPETRRFLLATVGVLGVVASSARELSALFRSAVMMLGADASDAIRRTVEWSVWNSQQLRGVSAAVDSTCARSRV